jgi:hypothetical protein
VASPVQVPPTRPPRSFAGPVVLIVLGIFFLLGNMRVLYWGTLGHWFAHYWPALLILWGVIKLFEYQQAQRVGRRSSGIGVGGAFLLIALILFGLAATQAERFNWDALRDHVHMGDDDFQIFGRSYNYEDQMAQAFPAGASLHVVDNRGAVNIVASDDPEIRVSVRKKVNADSQSDADKRNIEAKPQINVNGNVVTVNANTDAGGEHGVTADLEIIVPRKASVVISSKHGDVSIMGREGDLSISNEHGDVSVSDITGKVALTLQNSSGRIEQVSSDVTIEGRANDVSIEDVKGSVHMDGEFSESVKLSRIAKTVVFKSSRTDMEFAGLTGDLSLDSGDLRANDMIGPLRMVTRSKDISLDGVSGDVRLQNQNGSVEVHLSKVGSTEITNRDGDIQIYVPDKSGFQVDAHTRNGEIETDFDDIKVISDNDNGTGTGSVGGGGPHITVSNEHGTIEIKKGSSAPPAPPVVMPDGKTLKPPKLPKMPKGPKGPAGPEATDN